VSYLELISSGVRMKHEVPAGKRVNISLLEKETEKKVSVISSPHTITQATSVAQYGWVLEVDLSKEEMDAALSRHNPEKTTEQEVKEKVDKANIDSATQKMEPTLLVLLDDPDVVAKIRAIVK
jgi:23S rRNA G2445 N2-methylase RlmL